MSTSHRWPCRPPRRNSSDATEGYWRVLASVATLVPTLVGCAGGGTTATTAPPEDTEPAPVLDFSSIAGEWAGQGLEESGIDFFIDASLEESARRGEQIGEVEYATQQGVTDCVMRWLAEESDDPVFVVLERRGNGPCPTGTVTLELLASDTLSYSFDPDNNNPDRIASGTLTPK